MSVAAGMMIAGTAMSVIGNLQEGDAAYDAAQLNASGLDENAKQVLIKSKEDERAYRVIARKDIGAMSANYSASGITLSGSALDVLGEAAATAEGDAINIKRQGQLQAAGLRREADIERGRGATARRNAQWGAAAALLQGGASAAYMSSGPAKSPVRAG